jgi:threonine aldolase
VLRASTSQPPPQEVCGPSIPSPSLHPNPLTLTHPLPTHTPTQYEQGGLAALGGLAFNVVPTQADGTLALADLAARVRASAPGDGHAALTAVVCLESTHNRCGGAVLPLAYMDAVKAWADGVGLPIHLDGARLFNAAAALG